MTITATTPSLTHLCRLWQLVQQLAQLGGELADGLGRAIRNEGSPCSRCMRDRRPRRPLWVLPERPAQPACSQGLKSLLQVG